MKEVIIVPLGGAGEIGKNCTAVCLGDDIVVVDAGLSFPHEEHYGVDIVVPDFSFLEENQDRVRGVFLTHAHEDHVGAVAFLLKRLAVPIYCTRFTEALVRSKLEERHSLKSPRIEVVEPGATVEAGGLSVEFVRVTHSIPESNALAVHTPLGIVLFTGDFKIDFTPVDGRQSDLGRLSQLASEGVLCLLSDSTNVDRPGWGPSESSVTEGLRKAFREAPGRIFMTMFASNIHRMQQAFDVAHETGRKVAVAGRRMETTIGICRSLGYIRIPADTYVRLDEVSKLRASEVVVLTTGSQGEPMAALTQMSRGLYNRVSVVPGDTVLYSARPIPGNEAGIWRTVNRLFDLGAIVHYEPDLPIHASGHAYREELMAMINLTKPFYLAPVHGEARHQHLYREMALSMGHAPHRIFRLRNGDGLRIGETDAHVEEGLARAGQVFIDQTTGTEIDPRTIEERGSLGHDGVAVATVVVDAKRRCVAARPEIAVRGLAVPDGVVDRALQDLCEALDGLSPAELGEREYLERTIAESVRESIRKTSQQRPLVVAVALEA